VHCSCKCDTAEAQAAAALRCSINAEQPPRLSRVLQTCGSGDTAAAQLGCTSAPLRMLLRQQLPSSWQALLQALQAPLPYTQHPQRALTRCSHSSDQCRALPASAATQLQSPKCDVRCCSCCWEVPLSTSTSSSNSSARQNKAMHTVPMLLGRLLTQR